MLRINMTVFLLIIFIMFFIKYISRNKVLLKIIKNDCLLKILLLILNLKYVFYIFVSWRMTVWDIISLRIHFSKYTLNRKSETYVRLSILLGISRYESSSGSDKSEKDIRIFTLRSYYVKNFVPIKFCEIVKYKFSFYSLISKNIIYIT